MMMMMVMMMMITYNTLRLIEPCLVHRRFLNCIIHMVLCGGKLNGDKDTIGSGRGKF